LFNAYVSHIGAACFHHNYLSPDEVCESNSFYKWVTHTQMLRVTDFPSTDVFLEANAAPIV